MRCEEVQEVLPSYARDRNASLRVRRHISSCPNCGAELERYDELLAGLRSMRDVTAPAPPGLVAALNAIPSGGSRLQVARTHVTRHRKAYIGGLALAAAGAAGAALWRARVRTAAA
jgi:anti-sigma factor RsiW